jgi:hypothetical protein
MKPFFALAAPSPWVGALLAFLTTAGLAAGVVPAILYDVPQVWQAIIIAACGLVTVPVGALLGVALRDWLVKRYPG